jgi:beta-galactosidase
VWDEDVRLMREAGVNLVTVGVFAWASLEPEPGRFEFAWLDRVLDLVHANGIRVDLATATASPPPWFSRAHPESLPVTRAGVRLAPGSRQAYCPSSREYRAAAVRLAEAVAGRYRDHPALALWHVNNEYGCHVAECFCATSAAAFRRWLRERYGSLDALNDAWGTAFWSQRYGDWEEIEPPRAAPTFRNPTQQLDFARFSSDELRDCHRAELEVLRRVTPDVPVTTNFMTPSFKPVDYFGWRGDVDVVSTDHYVRIDVGDAAIDLALSGDLTRGLAGGEPWLLMEHSTSAVNWQQVNPPKAPGQMRRDSLAHVARGSDGALFFQWRASRAGAEKFHSGMVPHAGTDSRVWRDVVALGADLKRLAPVAGARVAADVALLWDYEAWWAVELDAHPSARLRYLDLVRAAHAALWRDGVTADVAHPESDLGRYRLLVAPSLYLVTDAAAANLERAVRAGAHLAVGPFSGIVDEHDHVRPGGYPGAFAGLLGARVEELRPLLDGAAVELDDGSRATTWAEEVDARDAEPVLRYSDGGTAATRRALDRGVAWYSGVPLARSLLARAWREAGVEPALPGCPEGVEAVRRGAFLFLLNHTDRGIAVEAAGTDLLTGARHDRRLELAAGGVAVLHA